MLPALRLFAAGCSLTGGQIDASCTGLPRASASSANLQNILVIFFGVLGALSVLFIIIGGFMYITSGGKPEETTKARETIIYAVVGLVVALLAEAVVAFVLGVLK